ncbi:hypothetical protein V7794_22720 [Rhizobium laguerreae]
MGLFNGQSTNEHGQSAIQAAMRTIEALGLENFDERAASAIESAVARSVLSTPQLHVDKKAGRRVTDERMTQDYGRRALKKSDYIDVTIPFTGNPAAFVLSPSTKTLGTPGEINDRRDGIVIRFPDNERLEQDLEGAIAQIFQNLGHLERDMALLATEMRSTLKGVAERRLEKLKTRHDLDSKRSFPIS